MRSLATRTSAVPVLNHQFFQGRLGFCRVQTEQHLTRLDHVVVPDIQLGDDATLQMLDGLPVPLDDDHARGVRGAVERRQKAPAEGAAERDQDDQRAPADGPADRGFRFAQIQHFTLPVDDEFGCHDDILKFGLGSGRDEAG